MRNQAEKLFQKHPKEKKRPAETKDRNVEASAGKRPAQQYKPLGKIDLDSLGKKPAKSDAPSEKPQAKPLP